MYIKRWLKWKIARNKVIKRACKIINKTILSENDEDFNLFYIQRFRILRLIHIIKKYKYCLYAVAN